MLERRPPLPLLLASAGLLVLLALPVVTLVGRALQPSTLTELSASGSWEALRLSLTTTSVALAVIVLLGTPVAYLLARYRFPGHGLIDALIDLPTVLPPVVAGVALLLVFGRLGLLGAPLAAVGVSVSFTAVAVVLAQVFVAAPFYVRALKVAFAAVPRELEAAALSDGATRWGAFWLITAPLAGRGFVEGALLAWSRALGEFGATIVFAGSLAGRTRTLPLAIYAALERDLNAAIALSALLTITALLLFLAVRALARRSTGERSPGEA
jgi:molybdate transport system permease protein